MSDGEWLPFSALFTHPKSHLAVNVAETVVHGLLE